MADFSQFCYETMQLDKAATEDILQGIKTKTIKKGDYLLKNGEVCRYLFFMNEGLAKTFFDKNGKEFIMRFFYENRVFSVFDSYLTQTPSKY